MKRMRIVGLVVVALAAAACATPPPGAGGGHVVASCPTSTKWAVGDSITAGVSPVLGWPDQNPPIDAGTYANKGIGGNTIAGLTYQTAKDLDECATQSAPKPQQIVFVAGSNDLAVSLLSVATMEGHMEQ